jgi:hypothetical protein
VYEGSVFATFKVEFQTGEKDVEVFRAGKGVISEGLIEYQATQTESSVINDNYF